MSPRANNIVHHDQYMFASPTPAVIVLQQQQKKKKKTVRFSNQVDYCLDKTRTWQQDNHELWYGRNDYASFRHENAYIVQAARGGVLQDHQDNDYYCTRGLERFISSNNHRKSRIETVARVLNEQLLQRKKKRSNAYVIKNISKTCSSSDRHQALALAAIDALFASTMWLQPIHQKQQIVAVFDKQEEEPRAMYSPPNKEFTTKTQDAATYFSSIENRKNKKRFGRNLTVITRARPRHGGFGRLFCQTVP